MKHIMFAALIFSAITLSNAQIEHAPIVAQCQADQRLWMSELEEHSKLPAFDVMYQRTKEMDTCQKVDTENKQRYYNTSAEMDAERSERYFDFINRHNLWEKFKEEDAAGMR